MPSDVLDPIYEMIKLGQGFKYVWNFHSYFGKIPIFTHIVSDGLFNHQLDKHHPARNLQPKKTGAFVRSSFVSHSCETPGAQDNSRRPPNATTPKKTCRDLCISHGASRSSDLRRAVSPSHLVDFPLCFFLEVVLGSLVVR